MTPRALWIATLTAVFCGAVEAQTCPGVEQAQFLSTTPSPKDEFGYSVAVSGDTALIGRPFSDEVGGQTGSAHVFRRSGSVWTKEAKLTAIDKSGNDRFGWSVALEGERAVIGVPQDTGTGCCTGSARVFERSGAVWTETATLLSSAPGAHDRLGWAVSLSGDTVLAGAPWDADQGEKAGSATIFKLSGSTWSEVAKLKASNGSSHRQFGAAVSLSGQTALIGSGATNFNFSSAWIFEGSSGSWVEEGELAPAVPQGSERIGESVAILGDRALVAAPNSSNVDPGRALLFERIGGIWTETHAFEALVPLIGDGFANTVALTTDMALIGAPYDDQVAGNGGAAYVYRFSGVSWYEEPKLTASDGAQGDEFARSIAVSPDTALIGAPRRDGAGADEGAAYAFVTLPVIGTNYCTAGTSASGCQALISALGAPSASASSGFCLSVRNVEGGKDGLFFYGPNGKQANSWGNGTSYVCVVPPRLRGGLLIATGSTAQACDGVFTQDLNARWCPTCPKPAHNYGPGATLQAQFWYRDPQSTSNQTSSMSDAVEFTVGP